MITYADNNFVWSRKEDLTLEDNLHTFISVALGLDDEVKHVFGTYLSFFELLTAGHTVVDATDTYNDGNFYVNFVKDNEIIETLEAPELVWALLLSEPVILELIRDARLRPCYANHGIAYYVKEGWSYECIGRSCRFIAPTGWALPSGANETDEEFYEKQVVILDRLKQSYSQLEFIHPDFLKGLKDLKTPDER